VKTEIEIVNLALAAAGATKLLAGDLATAAGAEAGFGRTFYPQRRDELLEDFRWFFSTRRAALALLEGVTRTDWGYVYALPADCRTAQQVVLPGMRNPRPEDSIPFQLEAGDAPAVPVEDDPLSQEPTATVLLCDLEAAELIYTANVTNPGRFSALFTAALGERLAIDFATHLTKKADLAAAAERRFLSAIGRAQVHSARQSQKDQPGPPDFLEGFQELGGIDPRFRFGVK
jgi:hypothetical protein